MMIIIITTNIYLVASMLFTALQVELAKHGQWLPIDPSRSERLTMGALLANNESGPRRFGYGTIREHLIGIKIMLADGKIIQGGGKVVKNVAGYDLCKLFVGSRGTLGVITEATFKLRPLPETEQFVQAGFQSPEKAAAFLDTVFESDLAPVVLDMHNLESRIIVVLGFAGTREDVEWQAAKTRDLGANEPSSLEYEAVFWLHQLEDPLRHVSVPPSRVAEFVRDLGKVSFVARAGNGVIWYRGGPEPRSEELPVKLMQRVKDTYDPNQILPGLSF